MNTIEILLENLGLRDLNPRSCGNEICEPGHPYGPAMRSYWLLHYVKSGCGIFQTNGQTYHVRPGQFFVIRPFETTFYKADQTDPWHYTWVGFDSALPMERLATENVVEAPGIGKLFRDMLDCGMMEAGRELFLCGKIWELLAALQLPASPAEDRSGEYVRRAQNYMESNYGNPINVTQIARYLSLDRCYFSTLFKQRTGRSPQQFLVDLRLQKAAELLEAGRCGPGEAARSAGYTDLCNFSRMFRRRFGISPTAYAERRQGG